MSRRRNSARYGNGQRMILGRIDTSYGGWNGAGSARSREMVLRSELPVMGSDMQPRYFVQEEHRSRRDRRNREREEERASMAPVMDRRGMRAAEAVLVLAVLLVVMLGFFVSGRTQIAAQNAKVARLESRIANADAEHEALQAKYDEAMDSLNVGMIAVGQGMISGKGSKVKTITLPEAINLKPSIITASADGH